MTYDNEPDNGPHVVVWMLWAFAFCGAVYIGYWFFFIIGVLQCYIIGKLF